MRHETRARFSGAVSRLLAATLLCVVLGAVGAEPHYEIVREFEGGSEGNRRGPSALGLCEIDQRLFFGGGKLDLATGEFSAGGVVRHIGADVSQDCGRVSSLGTTFSNFTVVMSWLAQGEGYVQLPVVGILFSLLASNQIHEKRTQGLAIHPANADRIFVAGFSGFSLGEEQFPMIIEVDLTVSGLIDSESGLIRTIPLDPAGIAKPSGLDIDPNTMDFYVTDYENGTLARLDPDGNLIETIDLAPLGIKQPDAVAFNPLNGHIFISDGSLALPFIAEIALFSRIPARDWMLYE